MYATPHGWSVDSTMSPKINNMFENTTTVPSNHHILENMFSLTIFSCEWSTVKCLYFVGYIFCELASKTWFMKAFFMI